MTRRAVFVFMLISSSAVWADSWLPPSKKSYLSSEKSARLTVTPRDLESALAYFEDKVEGREPAGALAGSKADSATAVLERRSASGQWEEAWTKRLVNEVAPVDTVVANNGNGFATLDNWHSMGYGPNVIAIYRGDGTLVRQFGLGDLFPRWFVAALPHSVSSIGWRGEPRLSRDQLELIIPVRQPASVGGGPVIDLHIRLSDGAPTNLQSSAWVTALNTAANTALTMCAVERDEMQRWNATIKAPRSNSEPDWHHYLREIEFRTAKSEESGGKYDCTSAGKRHGFCSFPPMA